MIVEKISKRLRKFYKNPENRIPLQGANNGMATLTNKQVRRIRKYWRTGNYTKTSLSDFFGVSRMTIRGVVNRNTYKNA